MRVILTRDVPNLGKEGELKNVAGGYARNYLIPRGLAVPATEGNLRTWQEQQKLQQARAERLRQQAIQAAQQLNGQTITLRGKTAPNSTRLFGAITAADIAQAIQQQFGIKVDKRRIELLDPIRTTGTHTVDIRWEPGVEATLTVEVQSEEPGKE